MLRMLSDICQDRVRLEWVHRAGPGCAKNEYIAADAAVALSWIIQLVTLLGTRWDLSAGLRKPRAEQPRFYQWLHHRHVTKESCPLTWAQLPPVLSDICSAQARSFLGNKNRLANSMVRKNHWEHYPEDIICSLLSGRGWLAPMLLLFPVQGRGSPFILFPFLLSNAQHAKSSFLYETAAIKDVLKLICRD